MPSAYLQPGDYAAYGVASTTTAAQVRAASALVDGFLDRPEGVVYLPDYAGLPCYMAAPAPSISFKGQGAVALGSNVVVPIGGNINLSDSIGEVVILDKANTSAVEACVLIAAASGSITLARVAQSHPDQCTLDFGLAIMDERALPSKRNIARVAARPIRRLLSGAGRFGYGRRSDQFAGAFTDASLLEMLQPFGGPPAWTPFDPTQASISPVTNEVWVPASLYLASYSDVRLWYVAGFTLSALPSLIKSATALAVNGAAQFPEITGNIKTVKAGDTAIARFSDSVLDADTRSQLASYKSLAFA
jgi:hypothetical protein